MNFLLLLPAADANPLWWVGIIVSLLLLFLFFAIFVVRQYKRCPSNRVLVIYGKVGGASAARCLHGGGTFIIPLIQDFEYLSLEPQVIEIPLEGALSLNNIRVNVPATFTVGISTDDVLMNNAAERLLGLPDSKIREQAQDIILGQLRLVIATLSIEEINKDREKFMALINENVAQEINKIGLDLINVNVRDITDESGYIQAIGKRAAAEAINNAKVEVALQDRDGAIGEAAAVREQNVRVSEEQATSTEGQKNAERRQRVAVSAQEAEAVAGEKHAEQQKRVQVAKAEALAIEGENESKAQVAEANANLAEVEASSRQRAEVAAAKAREAVLIAERHQETARLGRDVLTQQEVERERIVIAAEAEAERLRREAQGEADATIARYNAEAEGIRKVLAAKADGYRELILSCAENPDIAPTLLMIEQLPGIVAEQVKAIQNLKIDKITVWDSGKGSDGKSSTSNFLSGMIGSLPAIHELASQAGIELPAVLGKINPEIQTQDSDSAPKA
ncbi:MAG: flotillin [Planctomycetota bacterium]|jgi:flotillin